MMSAVRFLCLSDIHGHADALGAVLATAERRGYSRILVAGDLCFPGPEPLATWQRLAQLGAICVQGVGDRALATVDPTQLRPRDDHERARLKRLLDTRAELGDAILRQLGKLPSMVRQPLGGRAHAGLRAVPSSREVAASAAPTGEHLLVVHGSPVDPLEPLTHDMDDTAIADMLGDDPASVVLCGGSHIPFDRLIERRSKAAGVPLRTRVINLGSVGEAPVETSRFAHATFVESTDDGIEVEQFIVPLGRAA
jgi:predicted phosphodiesterase